MWCTQLQGLDPDKPVEITLDASDESSEEDKEDPSLSQGATPPELTPRSQTGETPLEVLHYLKLPYTGYGQILLHYTGYGQILL